MPDIDRRTVAVALLLLLAVGLVTAATTDVLTPVSDNTDGTVVVQGQTGPAVNLTGDTKFYNASGGTAGGDGLQLNTTDGNITFISQQRANATIATTDINGSWTVVTGLNVSNDLYINPDDKRAVNVSGDATRLEFRDAQLDDGNIDFIYAGSSGTTTVTVRGLKASAQVRAVDSTTGDVLDIATTDSNGIVTFDGMSNSEHIVELKSGASNPILDDPQPDGNVSSQPSEFSVNVTDDDFPGDNVTLEWYYEGSQIDTTYATSDGRYNTTNVPNIGSGIHDWSVIARDDNGNQDVINATVGLPGTIYIRNETNASELVDSPIDVTVTFENGTIVTERTTSDGTIDMDGLPTTDFIVKIEASQDYHQRTVYFSSIIGNASVYLLNTSYSSVESRFALDDPTGQYSSESVVIIKKAINQSGTNKYRTIYSDQFGTEGVTADLQQDERYQISIRGSDGTVQQVGPYRADVGEDVMVQPGAPSIPLGEYQKGWATAAELNNRTLEFRYSDPANETAQVTVWIHEKGNTSNRLRPNSSYYDLGNFSGTFTLTKNESEKTWVVNFITDRDGKEFTAREEVSNKADLVPDLDREWRLITGIGILLISAGVFSLLNAGIGGVIVAMEGGVLWWTGWLTGATTGAGVVIALFVAVVFHLYSSSGP